MEYEVQPSVIFNNDLNVSFARPARLHVFRGYVSNLPCLKCNPGDGQKRPPIATPLQPAGMLELWRKQDDLLCERHDGHMAGIAVSDVVQRHGISLLQHDNLILSVRLYTVLPSAGYNAPG